MAIPLRDTSSASVAKVPTESWISIFGVPSVITTDRGSQLPSTLFRELNQLLGSTHPEANGLGEHLPIIPLAIRNTVKEDLGCCPAELVLGTTIRLPGEMFANSQDQTLIDPSSYSPHLKEHFRSILPTPTHLSTCPFVFVRVDTVKKPLQRPYDGPYKVLKRESRNFILDRSGAKDSVSTDRLKPAYLEQTPKPESAVPTLPSSSTT
nr:gag pol polyprotein [Hymenolepis microstoma]